MHLEHNTKTTAVIAKTNNGARPNDENRISPIKALKTNGACFLLYALTFDSARITKSTSVAIF